MKIKKMIKINKLKNIKMIFNSKLIKVLNKLLK